MEIPILCTFAVHETISTGSELAILGNCRQLGNWDETCATPLVRSQNEDGTDTWAVTISLPLGECVHYKYIVRCKGRVTAWETLLGNRCVVPGMRNITSNNEVFRSRQSSTYVGRKEPFSGPRGSEIAINGSTSSHHEHMCQHTQLDQQAWWDVDLNRCYNIEKIMLWNRTGSAKASCIVPFWVLLSDIPFPPWRMNTLDEARSVAKYAVRINRLHDVYELNVVETVSCRYCRIILEEENYLHFAEVQLWERVDTSVPGSIHQETKQATETRQCSVVDEAVHFVDDGSLNETDSMWLGGKSDGMNLITMTLNSGVDKNTGGLMPSIDLNDDVLLDDTLIPSMRCTTMFNGEEKHILPTTSSDIFDEGWSCDVLRYSFHFAAEDLCSGRRRSGSSSSSSSSRRSLIMLEVVVKQDKEQGEKIVGKAFLSLMQLDMTLSRGRVVLPVFKTNGISGTICGSITMTYVIAKPFQHLSNTLENVYRTYWSKSRRSTLDVGHRGLGKSQHKSKPEYRLSAIKENSLMSFIVAGKLGADFIEFDVLLTKDNIPVVFHDFELSVSMEEESIGVREDGGSDDLVVGVHQLKFHQLRRAKTRFKSKHPSRLRTLVKRHFEKLLALTENGQKLLALRQKRRNAINRWGDRTPKLAAVLESIPTLRSLFSSVPIWVGFNIEIKYPIETKHEHLRALNKYECNTYVNTILECVFNHAHSRRIVFSCFDPDVCMLLQAKQARYPVLFLTCSGICADFEDATCLSLRAAWMFAKTQRLQGIVAESTPILAQPSVVREIKQQDLLLFTWGSKNTELTNVIVQKKLGVDGIISDNISDLVRMQGKEHNIFRDDLLLANVPELMPRDPAKIAGFNMFRENYRSFRVGKARGAKGEVSRFAEEKEK